MSAYFTGKPFNGYVLGGLYFEQKSDEQPAHSENGVAINNRFSYVVVSYLVKQMNLFSQNYL